MSAAQKAGYEDIHIFIDAEMITKETREKWRSWRIKEVEREERNMPLAVNILLGDACKMYNNAQVHYSSEADNDDTLAAYATCVLMPLLMPAVDHHVKT